MKNHINFYAIFFLIFFIIPFSAFSQILFTENFETAGTAQTQLTATSFIGWKNFNVSGSNNYWWIFDNTRCGVITGTYSLAISKNSPATSGTIPAYNATASSNQVAYFGSKINAVGYSSVKLNFNWKCNGEIIGSTYYDYGRVCYSFDGTIWVDFPTSANYQGQTATQTVTNLDISAVDNSQFYLGFRWINDASNANNPPLIIDDISVTASIASSMTFISCTATQNNTSTLAPSAVTQEIIGIQIVTSGSANPLSVTQFTVNANGSTNINDINATNSAKIYYTGTSAAFATTTLFGQNTPAIANYNIAGSQTLSSGTNYFWLVYDINAGATLGNVVDGECTSLNVSGVRTPTVTAPGGNRTIALSYCTNTNTTSSNYYINNFSTTGGVSNITNNGSGFSTNGYGNFTGLTVSGIQGNSINFSTSFGSSSSYTFGLGIFIDWNQDGDFADAGEQVYNSAGYISSATGSFSVPLTATPGNTRIRVVADYLSTTPVACPGNSHTECEDYTFNVIAQVACAGTPNAGSATISSSSGCSGAVFFLSAAGLSTGSGISYQWQSSVDGISGWSNISGATSSSYSTTTASTAFYRLMTTCSFSSLGNYTNVVSYNIVNCTNTNVPVSGSNNVACGSGTNLYDNGGPAADYSASSNGYTVLENSGTGIITITGTYTGIETCCDHLNFYSGIGTGGTLLATYNGTGTITPIISAAGAAITVQFTSDGSVQGAGFEVQVNYSGACAVCSGTPSAGMAIAIPATICIGSSSIITVSGYPNSNGLNFQWESSPNNSFWSTIAGATSNSYIAIPAYSMYYRCKITCTNSGLFGFSASAFVSITSQPNDLPCNAQTILINDLTPGDLSCATGTGEPAVPPCWTNGVINTVWYKFQAPASGNVKIKTIVGTLLNTQIALYSGTCGPGLTLVLCNDDVSACGSSYYYNSELSASGLTVGAWYYIAVDGYSNLAGTFSIVWVDAATPWPPVPGQDCISGVPLCSSTFSIGNPGYQAVGNICDFPGGSGNCLLSGERGSVWYEITINASGNLMFTLEPNDAVADLPGLVTDDGTDYDFGIWKKTGTGAVTCADIAAGAIPLACNYSYIGVTGLYSGGITPPSDSYTGHTYTAGAYDAAFEPPLAVSAGEVYWLVISNFSNSLSGFAIDFLNSTNGFNFNIPNPLIWTGGASSTNWFDPKNWGNCSQIPDSSHSCIVAASSFYQPVINAAGAECKSITINSGASLTINSGFNLNVYGSYNNQGSFNASPASSVTIVGGATQALDGIMVTPSEFFDLIINKPVSKNVNANQHIECDGSFRTMNTNGKMNMNSNNLTIGGNFTNFNGNSTYNPGTGTLFFDGSSGQTYTNINNILILNNLTMIHTGSGVTITKDLILGASGILTLTSGKIITDGYTVIVNYKASGAVTPGNTTSYVEGNLRRYLNPTGSYDFPVGHALKGYQRANFNFTVGTSIDHLTASFTPYSSLPGPLNLTECSVTYNMPPLDNGFWTLTANANPQTGKYTATLYNLNYTNASGGTAFTVMSAHSSLGGTWQLLNGDGTNGTCVSSPVTAVVRQNMSGFSNFGTAITNSGPLPIELLSFTGKAFGKVNLLEWTTATETNNDYFVPEKSADGVNFVEMTHVKGAGNSNSKLYYSLTDADPISPVTYYKLKQVDFDGQYSYSDIISVDRNNVDSEQEVVSIFPNPASNLINIELFASQEGYVEITIMDMFDQIIFRRNDAIQSGKNILTYDISTFAQGMYFTHVKFIASGNTTVNRFVKK